MATTELTTSRLEELLGADAESLLKHDCKTIDARDLHLPGPDFVDRVWSISDRNPQVLRNLAVAVRLRPPGRHRLRLDPARRPGHRALGGRELRAEPDLLRPREHRQARDRGRLQRRRLDVRRARRGLHAATPTRSRSSSSSTTTSSSPTPTRYDQILFGSVQRAWDLGAAGVGATIYFGSEESRPPDRRDRPGLRAGARARHGHRAVVLPAQPGLQGRRRRLPRCRPT